MITTKRLIIRRFQASDLKGLRVLESDPDVMKFTGPGRAQSLEESEVNLKKYMKIDGDYGYFAVEETLGNILIGLLMLKLGEEDEVELGFMFSKNSWGKGFASESSSAMMSWFSSRNKATIFVGKTYEDNIASNLVLQKLGFKYVEKVIGKLNKPLLVYKYFTLFE